MRLLTMCQIWNKHMSAMRRELFKFILCAAVIWIAIIYFSSNLTYIPALYKTKCRQKTVVSNANLIGRDCSSVEKLHEVNRYHEELHRAGLPTDYFERDFIEDNDLVDKLVPLLKSNIDVIEETQRIHHKMLKKLIGKFKFAMLFNFVVTENKGDPAITLGELHMIRKLGIELIYHCESSCTKPQLEIAKNLSKQYSKEDLVILLQGGGDLLCYLGSDFNRKMVLEMFPDFNVVLFPQSLWLNATLAQTKYYQNMYASHKHLTFLYRDRTSYKLGKKLFPDVKSYLMPDMAFQIGEVQRFIIPTHDIMWLKRTDKESLKYKLPTSIQTNDVILQDWYAWQSPRTQSRLEDSVTITATGMTFLQRGRVVITDRLHGHILSVLCGIPHVVLDPVNSKITSFMKTWTGGIDNILVASSADDAMQKALQLLTKLNNKLPETLPPFQKMKQ